MKLFTNYIKVLCLLISLFVFSVGYCQQTDQQKKQPTRDEIMNMSYEQLLNLPFEDLINLADIVGVSAEELLQMILNKDVSSASKSKEKVFQSPLSTTVISKEELEKSGATNIPEALRLVPGMIVREKTPGNYDIHIRGYDNLPPKNMFVYSEDALTLVMIDNRPVYNYSFGGTFWETLPIDISDVERIEVIRGPSSALYGPNAVAGVINIITKNPDSKKLTVSASTQVGTPNSTIGNVGITKGLNDNFKVRLSGNYEYRQRFENNFYVFGQNRYLSYAQMDTLRNYWTTLPQQVGSIAESNFSSEIQSPNLATDKYGANAFLYFDPSSKVSMTLSGGLQRSTVVTSTLGNHAIPIDGRSSSTQYVDFTMKAVGLTFQTNYMYGNQEVEMGDSAWHIAPRIYNADLEYEWKTNNLTLRPGISYQKTVYTDQYYVNIAQQGGFLNGPKALSGAAIFLRADYHPFEKLRLIAAIRADKYSIPDTTYVTYQFVATYNLDENNLIRFVYSRANRGPFIVDSHADYNWKILTPSAGDGNFNYNLWWTGNQNLKLPVMDMFELGYRSKIKDRIMIDIEAFTTSMNDFSYFRPDSMSMTMDWMPVFLNPTASPAWTSTTGYIKYHNFTMSAQQIGLTVNINAVVNQNLNFRVFGTLQQTYLKNVYNQTIWDDFSNLLNADGALVYKDGVALATGSTPAQLGINLPSGLKTYTSSNPVTSGELVNEYNKSTPTFFGGASVDYNPLTRVNVFASAYYFSKQTIQTNQVEVSNALNAQNMYNIQSKFIMDVKISYKSMQNGTIFFNARNLFDNESREFAYMDKIGGTYLIGLSLSF